MMINKGINCIKINFALNRRFARKTKGSHKRPNSVNKNDQVTTYEPDQNKTGN